MQLLFQLVNLIINSVMDIKSAYYSKYVSLLLHDTIIFVSLN